MDRAKAQKILEAFGRPTFKAGNTKISFARQESSDLDYIESQNDEQLVNSWKDLVYSNEILGQVSLNELQRIALLELEMENRGSIDKNVLKSWYDVELSQYDESDIYGPEDGDI